MLRFKISFDQLRLLVIFVLVVVAVTAPTLVAISAVLCAIAINLWLLHDHLFIRIGRFEWGNKRFDV